jgi:hypothetical protein
MNNLHLKLANIRRFLDKHAPNDKADAPELDGKIKERFYNIIKRDCLPLAIRRESNNTFDVILMERDPKKTTFKNSKSFYVLEVNFCSAANAHMWIGYIFGQDVKNNTYYIGC